jgi:hypothetical protein
LRFAAEARRNEIPIKPRLLLRRKHRTNLDIRIKQNFPPLPLEIPPELSHSRTRIFHHLPNLLALARRELELSAHLLYWTLARRSQPSQPVRGSRAREPQREPGQQSGDQ